MPNGEPNWTQGVVDSSAAVHSVLGSPGNDVTQSGMGMDHNAGFSQSGMQALPNYGLGRRVVSSSGH
eukprot:5244651-Karenia_brevis.AAC.1